MNWILIAVGLTFAICIIVGYVRGILRIGVSLLATIATIVLVMFLTPYAGDALEKYSPINSMVEEQCIKLFTPEIGDLDLSQIDLSGTSLENLDEDQLAAFDLESAGVSMSDITTIVGELPKDEQIKLIEESKIPSFMQSALLSNNNSEIYNKLGISSFPEFIGAYISKIIINILSFVITFILVTVIVRALIVAVDIISDLPVLGLATRFAGAALGAVAALIIVWVGFLIVTLTYATGFGAECFEQISASGFLTLLYENNMLLKLLMSSI